MSCSCPWLLPLCTWPDTPHASCTCRPLLSLLPPSLPAPSLPPSSLPTLSPAPSNSHQIPIPSMAAVSLSPHLLPRASSCSWSECYMFDVSEHPHCHSCLSQLSLASPSPSRSCLSAAVSPQLSLGCRRVSVCLSISALHHPVSCPCLCRQTVLCKIM